MHKKSYKTPHLREIDPATVKDPKVLEAIQKLQQMAQEARDNCEVVKQPGIFHKLVQPLAKQE